MSGPLGAPRIPFGHPRALLGRLSINLGLSREVYLVQLPRYWSACTRLCALMSHVHDCFTLWELASLPLCVSRLSNSLLPVAWISLH